MAYSFTGYDRPECGNLAWVTVSMMGEAGMHQAEPIREYLKWLENRVLELQAKQESGAR